MSIFVQALRKSNRVFPGGVPTGEKWGFLSFTCPASLNGQRRADSVSPRAGLPTFSVWGATMSGWFRDARYAVRQLTKSPVFTLTAIVTLALGIGANSTIFSWMNSTLFTPVPGASPKGELIAFTRGDHDDISYPDYLDLRDHSQTVTNLIGYTSYPIDLTGRGKPQRLWAELTTANYFDALGVQPLKGRFFQPSEGEKPDGAPVAVLSYRTWQLLFDGDPQIVGRIVNLNQHPFNIIGIAPPLFQGATTGLRMDMWAPLMMRRELEASDDAIHDRGHEWINILGTLGPGVTRGAVQQELTAAMKNIAQSFPHEHQG